MKAKLFVLAAVATFVPMMAMGATTVTSTACTKAQADARNAQAEQTKATADMKAAQAEQAAAALGYQRAQSNLTLHPQDPAAQEEFRAAGAAVAKAQRDVQAAAAEQTKAQQDTAAANKELSQAGAGCH